ncbi:MAG: L,D-transpeptidase family protein [Bradyrhizobiaceae bacterium]|nr:L,D-transpeptidase family protein [Hyphomicrobiales bacterium]MBV9428685.1 L,D-transpeptidase family protein [Bradyrhizobiaceae bacterium]
MTRIWARARAIKAQHRPGWLAAAAVAALIAVPDPAGAARRHHHAEHSAETVAPRAAGNPLMAIVSIKSQRVTIYDADGWILRAPVSTGQRGRETPAGVFSVIQKEKDHYSNLYDDAYMPNMQRITWSGIALHGGPLPGHPASHGCIRMPYGFAEGLFGKTAVGMRVIIAPRDATPVDISHPALFSPKPDDAAHAKALAAEASEAARKADAARAAAATAEREAARARMTLRAKETLKARAEAERAAAEKAVDAATSDEAKARATDNKAKAEAKLADVQAQWDAANAELQPKLDAANQTREAAAAAESARAAAAKAAREAARELEPVSVFISRKTQRLYVRRGFEPILESPVTIRDPEKPIGTHVFTAVDRTDDGLRWTVVSLNEANDAKSALDRLVIPQDVLDRIAPTASPRSSLIISDEALSRETGKGTDFIAVLSNEPQGGLAMRHHPTPAEPRYARARERHWGSSDRGNSSGRWTSSGGWSSSSGWNSSGAGGSWGSPYGGYSRW